jgi:hypothetical protein
MRFEIELSVLQQRALVLVLTGGLIAGACLSVFGFVSEQIAHHKQVALLTRELAQRRALAEQTPSLQRRVAALKTSLFWRRAFIPHDRIQPNAAQADHLAQLVSRYGGRIEGSCQPSPSAAEVPSQKRECVRFAADISTLAHVLYELRQPTPLTVIRRLSVFDTERIGDDPRLAPNKLHIELAITTFMEPS